jgi:hypothetical protein
VAKSALWREFCVYNVLVRAKYGPKFACFVGITPSDVGIHPSDVGTTPSDVGTTPSDVWIPPLVLQKREHIKLPILDCEKKNNRPRRVVWGVSALAATNSTRNHAEHPYYRAD